MTAYSIFHRQAMSDLVLSKFAVDITGQVFGKLVVVRPAEQDRFKAIKWECRCECGGTTLVRSNDLRRGRIIACGCQRGARVGGLRPSRRTHRKEYNIWSSMKDRCSNSNNENFSNYGGRGIEVCERWLSSFSNFIEDMGAKPFADASIERVDVNGNYCPENCTWIPLKDQWKNRRVRGEKKP